VETLLEIHRLDRLQELVDAGMKKPISGGPEIGAHFVSFNFPNIPFR
jgi:hypothetical protein